MNQFGYVRVMAVTPELKVANCSWNVEKIAEKIEEAERQQCDLVVFPELCVTGYTCGDLFLQDTLLRSAEQALRTICRKMQSFSVIALVGVPIRQGAALYNAAAVLQGGSVRAFVPKCNIPNYGELHEGRYFTAGFANGFRTVRFDGADVPFGSFVFEASCEEKRYTFGAELCEDLWVPQSPSTGLALRGAQILCNLSANNEVLGKLARRRLMVSAHSAKTVSAYVYCDAGCGESTTDAVFSGHKMICENGKMLRDSGMFGADAIVCDVDTEALAHDRQKKNTFSIPYSASENGVIRLTGRFTENPESLLREYARFPFIPVKAEARDERCREILDMQGYALKKRLLHARAQSAVIGISGGLDSTLALLAAVRAFDLAGLDRKKIYCVTMPCFGTSERTHRNAIALCEALGVSLQEVDIRKAVLQHFEDIGQDASCHDVTYENSQARERTQVLMDLANRTGGLVIGTGDLSELALGWATYNGDQMSMYGVNASIPKTLIRHVVAYCAENGSPELNQVLTDILDTPVSPELLPPEAGKISQKTEDLVGPYELHDFFLYYFMRYGFTSEKILFLAEHTFRGVFDTAYIRKWLQTFFRRFFAQQFKRSCMPDGPKIGAVALSPRGDLQMPSDADSAEWLDF